MTFLKVYAKVIRYSSEIPALMKAVSEQPHEDTNRLVLADALGEEGRHVEEAHCRDLSKPIFVHDNKVWGAAPREVYNDVINWRKLYNTGLRKAEAEYKSYDDLHQRLQEHNDPAQFLIPGIKQYAHPDAPTGNHVIGQQHGLPEDFNVQGCTYNRVHNYLHINGGGSIELTRITLPNGERNISYTLSPHHDSGWKEGSMFGYVPEKDIKQWLPMIVAPHHQERLQRLFNGEDNV
jgi:uncharacterized protein (TIGR02996 family)